MNIDLLEECFHFYHLEKVSLPSMGKKESKELLSKWAMANGMQVQAYSFDRPFKPYLQKDFLQDFFRNQTVISTLLRATSDGAFTPIGMPGEVVQSREIPCTVTSMDFFDRLVGPVVREGSGSIKMCLPEYYKPYDEGDKEQNEIEIADELRKMFLRPEDSNVADIFTPQEKDEFLFHIFRHFAIGGYLCQFENYVNPYLELTRGLYKDLVSVTKSTDENNEISTTSTVIQVFGVRCDSVEEGKNLLFPTSQFNNFLYLVVDPHKRVCFTWYHSV